MYILYPVVPPTDKIQLITCIVPLRDINIKWLQKVFFSRIKNGTTFSYLSLDIMSTHNSIFFLSHECFYAWEAVLHWIFWVTQKLFYSIYEVEMWKEKFIIHLHMLIICHRNDGWSTVKWKEIIQRNIWISLIYKRKGTLTIFVSVYWKGDFFSSWMFLNLIFFSISLNKKFASLSLMEIAKMQYALRWNGMYKTSA